jgi:hypothetical protein
MGGKEDRCGFRGEDKGGRTAEILSEILILIYGLE